MMSDKKEMLQNIDFDNLILESEKDPDLEYPAQGEMLAKRRIAPKPMILVIWLASLLLGALITMDSIHTTERVGSRGAEVQLGVALYHLAHRVETYKDRTGNLPDYLEPQWQESGEVEYRVTNGRYHLSANAGGFVREYSQGEDPELLLFKVRRLGQQEQEKVKGKEIE